MVNLIAGQEVVPELVQHDFTADNVVRHLSDVIRDGDARDRMVAGLAAVRSSLRGENSDLRDPAERAANAILGLSPAGFQSKNI